MRSVKEITTSDYYHYLQSTRVEHHYAWWNESTYVDQIRPCMIQSRLFRLYLSNGQQKVVEPDAILFLERY